MTFISRYCRDFFGAHLPALTKTARGTPSRQMCDIKISEFFSTHLVILPDLHKSLLFFLDMSLFGRFRQFFEHGLWTQQKGLQIMGILFLWSPFLFLYTQKHVSCWGLHPKLLCHNNNQKIDQQNPKQQKNHSNKNGANDDNPATDRNIPIFPFCPTPFVGPWNHRHHSWWASLVAS